MQTLVKYTSYSSSAEDARSLMWSSTVPVYWPDLGSQALQVLLKEGEGKGRIIKWGINAINHRQNSAGEV